MIGQTLSLYISMKFVKILLAMVVGLGFLIITVDFIEQLRKSADDTQITIGSLYMISMLRAPVFIEKAFPFACLFAAMITLTQLNTKMELVVARSAGVSAWQFLLPISLSAALIGVFIATAYNPLAIKAFEQSVELEAEVRNQQKGEQNQKVHGYWIRQEEEEGSTVINSRLARRGGTLLDDVKIIRFNKQGGIVERIGATNAIYRGDYWMLVSVKLTTDDGLITKHDTMKLPTRLTRDALLGASTPPESVSFWKLRNTAEKVSKTGTNAKPYMVQYHSLTALPLFLVAMVLVAATVCLRFVRFGQFGRMILGGILSGFVLYTITKLVTALGSNGVVPPAVAAWSPAFVATLFGMSILLHQEDG